MTTHTVLFSLFTAVLFLLSSLSLGAPGQTVNQALTALSVPVALPVPSTIWCSGGELTCEFWIKPGKSSASCPVLALGSAVLSLKNGELCLKGEPKRTVQCSGRQVQDCWREPGIMQPPSSATRKSRFILMGRLRYRRRPWPLPQPCAQVVGASCFPPNSRGPG